MVTETRLVATEKRNIMILEHVVGESPQGLFISDCRRIRKSMDQGYFLCFGLALLGGQWCHLPRRRRPGEGLAWKHRYFVFAMLTLSCLSHIEGERSEKLLGTQWKGSDWRFKFGTHWHEKLNKTVNQSCNLSWVCATFSQKKSPLWNDMVIITYYLGFW